MLLFLSWEIEESKRNIENKYKNCTTVVLACDKLIQENVHFNESNELGLGN